MSQSSDEGADTTPTVESVNTRLRAQIAGLSKDAAQGEKKFMARQRSASALRYSARRACPRPPAAP